MKNRFAFIFVLNLLMIVVGQASEGGFAAKSRALFEVISAIEAARYDLPVSYELNDGAEAPASQNCQQVAADEVIFEYDQMIEAYQLVYPDEELPYDSARKDFIQLVGVSDYIQCSYERVSGFEVVEIESFKSISGSFMVSFVHHIFK